MIDSNNALTHEEAEFLKFLHSLGSGVLPPRSDASDFGRADKELNDAYRFVLSKAPKEYKYDHKYEFTRDTLRKTQRARIQYRDEWAAFGVQRYPNTTADTWRTWITRQRVMELEGIQMNAKE